MCVRAVVWLPHQMLKSTFIEIFRKTFRILAQLCDVRMVYLTFMLNACFTYRNNYAWNYSTPSHSAKNGPQKKSSLSEVFQTLEILQSITSKSEKTHYCENYRRIKWISGSSDQNRTSARTALCEIALCEGLL